MSAGVARPPTVSGSEQKYKKIILTGHIIEVYEMENIPYQNFEKEERKKTEWIEAWEDELRSLTLDEKLEKARYSHEYIALIRDHNRRQDKNIYRTRGMVRRLALSNFDNGSKFVTFTFAENITDIKKANEHWWLFMQRMRRKYGNFKYMAVIEFQNRGAVHYHCIMDLPYIKKQELSDIWGNGFIKINRIKHVDNIGAYIVKYMTKELFDERFVAMKAYQCSKGLQRPIVLRGEEAEQIYEMYGLEKQKEVFANSYESEYLGKIHYKEYNLKRL